MGAIIQHKPAQGLDQIHSTLDGGSDPRQFTRQIVDYLRSLLLIRMGNANQVDATTEVKAQMAEHAGAFDTATLLSVIRAFNYAASEARGVWQPNLALEMAFVDSLEKTSNTGSTTPPQTPSNTSRRQVISESPSSSSYSTKNDIDVAAVDASPANENDVLGEEDQQATHGLAKSWPRILSLVRDRNPQAYGLLNSSKSRYIRGKHLYLGFASDLLLSRMEAEDNIAALHDALNQVFDRELEIVCRVDTAKRGDIPAGVDNDGMVAAAVRDLGGEIVDIQ